MGPNLAGRTTNSHAWLQRVIATNTNEWRAGARAWLAFGSPGLSDGACGNRPHLALPWRKEGSSLTLGASYNAFHSFLRFRVKQLFEFLWHFALIQRWTRSMTDKPFKGFKVLLKFANVYARWYMKCELPVGLWNHFPEAPPDPACDPSDAPDPGPEAESRSDGTQTVADDDFSDQD